MLPVQRPLNVVWTISMGQWASQVLHGRHYRHQSTHAHSQHWWRRWQHRSDVRVYIYRAYLSEKDPYMNLYEMSCRIRGPHHFGNRPHPFHPAWNTEAPTLHKPSQGSWPRWLVTSRVPKETGRDIWGVDPRLHLPAIIWRRSHPCRLVVSSHIGCLQDGQQIHTGER